MGHSRLSLLVGLCILATTSQNEVITNIPGGCCLGNETRNDIMYLVDHPNVTSKTECWQQCNKTEICVGVNWTSNSGYKDNECKLLTVVNRVTLQTLVNCEDASVRYCWKVKSGVHQERGVQKLNVSNETDCKKICVDNRNCTGVVWNLKHKQCWILLKAASTKPLTDRANYWTIVRDLPRTFQNTNLSSQLLCESTTVNQAADETDESSIFTETSSIRFNFTESSTIISREQQKFMLTVTVTITIALAGLLGLWTLIIIGLSIYAVKLKKRVPYTNKFSTPKKSDEVKVVEVEEVDEDEHDDDEKYVDYEDLRKIDDPKTYEEACEYTAMELENMKDDDNVYYNEDQ